MIHLAVLVKALFMVGTVQASQCIYRNSETAGLEKPFGILTDDQLLLKSNWKAGFKIAQVDYCTDPSNLLVGFWI